MNTINTDRPTERVVFFKDCDNGGEIVAVFPDQICPDGSLVCYSHIGQHSTCSRRWARGRWRLTPPCGESVWLYRELEGIGYNLEVVGKSAIPKAA